MNSNTFLQKKMRFASCKKFYIDLWSFLVAELLSFLA